MLSKLGEVAIFLTQVLEIRRFSNYYRCIDMKMTGIEPVNAKNISITTFVLFILQLEV